jgi:hypothetical protein
MLGSIVNLTLATRIDQLRLLRQRLTELRLDDPGALDYDIDEDFRVDQDWPLTSYLTKLIIGDVSQRPIISTSFAVAGLSRRDQFAIRKARVRYTLTLVRRSETPRRTPGVRRRTSRRVVTRRGSARSPDDPSSPSPTAGGR